MRSELAGLPEQLGVHAIDFRDQRVERSGVDFGIAVQRCEQLLLPLELLQDVGLQIGARGKKRARA